MGGEIAGALNQAHYPQAPTYGGCGFYALIGRQGVMTPEERH
jgi:hypothetical protein